MSAFTVASTPRHWLRALLLLLLSLVLGFLSLRGTIAIWQQVTRHGATAEPAPVALTTPAAPTKEMRQQRAQGLVQRIGEGKARVVDVFASPTGLTGVVLDTGSGRVVAWMPDAGEVLFIGAAFDSSGTNISQVEMVGRGFATPETNAPNAAPLPNASNRNSAVPLRALERSAGFVEGASGPTIIAFIDLNCAYCSQLWRLTRAPIAAGRLRVRWVPVAVVAPDSEAKAAQLLQAPDPIQALAAHEARNTMLLGSRATRATAEAIAANGAVLDVVTGGRPATPVLVARDAAQKPVVAIGLPSDWPAFLQEAR